MVNVKTEVVIDYALPTLKAERALKDMHNAMLDNKYAEAMVFCMNALVEVRMASNAIRHKLEPHDGA